jgi:hypothetical protein
MTFDYTPISYKGKTEIMLDENNLREVVEHVVACLFWISIEMRAAAEPIDESQRREQAFKTPSHLFYQGPMVFVDLQKSIRLVEDMQSGKKMIAKIDRSKCE